MLAREAGKRVHAVSRDPARDRSGHARAEAPDDFMDSGGKAGLGKAATLGRGTPAKVARRRGCCAPYEAEEDRPHAICLMAAEMTAMHPFHAELLPLPQSCERIGSSYTQAIRG